MTPKDIAGLGATIAHLGWELEAAQLKIRQLEKELAEAKNLEKDNG